MTRASWSGRTEPESCGTWASNRALYSVLCLRCPSARCRSLALARSLSLSPLHHTYQLQVATASRSRKSIAELNVVSAPDFVSTVCQEQFWKVRDLAMRKRSIWRDADDTPSELSPMLQLLPCRRRRRGGGAAMNRPALRAVLFQQQRGSESDPCRVRGSAGATPLPPRSVPANSRYSGYAGVGAHVLTPGVADRGPSSDGLGSCVYDQDY